MNEQLNKIAVLLEDRLKRNSLTGRTVTIKINYYDFKILTRSWSFSQPINDLKTITATAKSLLAEISLEGVKVRLIGITLSKFGEKTATSKEDKFANCNYFEEEKATEISGLRKCCLLAF